MRLTYFYFMVNDIVETKTFYGDLLGLKVTAFKEPHYVNFDVGGSNMLFFKSDSGIDYLDDWAWQPGYAKGKEAQVNSFSLECDELNFRRVYKALKDSPSYPMKSAAPEWKAAGYWGLTVKDPNGRTVEIYSVPTTKPSVENPVWKDL